MKSSGKKVSALQSVTAEAVGGKSPATGRRSPRDEPRAPARETGALTIGRLATLGQVSIDTIRFYEKEHLLAPGGKTTAGYRLYGEKAVRRLRFIRHAQECGFLLAEIRALLELRSRDDSCCGDVRNLAVRKKLQLENKIKSLKAMSQALSELIEVCAGNRKPLDECPILGALETRLTGKPPLAATDSSV